MNSSEKPDLELVLRGGPEDIRPIRIQFLPADPQRPRRDSIQSVLDALTRRRALLVSIVLLTLLAGIGYDLSRPRYFRAAASIQVSAPATAESVGRLVVARELIRGPAQVLNLSTLPEYSRRPDQLIRGFMGGGSIDESEPSYLRAVESHLHQSYSAENHVIDLEFDCTDPTAGTAFLDLLAESIARNHAELGSSEVTRVRSTFGQQIAVARAQVKIAEDDLLAEIRAAAGAAPLSSLALSVEARRREVSARQSAYDELLRKEMDAVSAATDNGGVRPLARSRILPNSPAASIPVGAILGLLSGFILGIPLCLLRDVTDSAIRHPADVSQYTGMQPLGIIPQARARSQRRQAHPLIDLSEVPDLAGVPRFLRTSTATASEVHSAGLADAFRHILASVWIAGQSEKRPRVLLVTSASRAEGKTTVAANLAVALANSRRRVLIIDAHLRDPQLHSILIAPKDWGLANVLEQDAPIEDYTFDELYFKTNVPGLYVLPAGLGHLAIADIRNVERMHELLMRFRLEFHAVLIDGPDASYPEVRVLAKLADAAIVVLRAGRTARHRAAALARQLRSDGATVLGAVLNDCRERY